MNRHDEQIQNLFDDYAKELAPRQDLADKAKMEMVASKQANQSVSARKKSSFWVHFAWITPVAAVFIAVIVAIFSLPSFIGGLRDKFGGDDQPSQRPQVAVAYYTYADVKGKSVNIADYNDQLQINRLTANGYQVVGQHCYAFFTEAGALRYIKAYLGIRSPDGTFTELTLIAEADGYVRQDLRDIYDLCSNLSGMGIDRSHEENGEYVTQAFFAARDYHFYVIARNGQFVDDAKDILEILAD